MKPLLAICFLLVFACGGCATGTLSGSSVREHLLKAFKPIQDAPFVRITGEISWRGDSDPRSFFLLMGPYPKFIYQCDGDIVFNDGKRRGRIDIAITPAKELLLDVTAESRNMAMSIGMVGGPTILALVREFREDDEWLRMLEAPPPVLTKYEECKLRKGGTEILVTIPNRRYRFVLRNSTGIQQFTSLVSDEASGRERYEVRIARIEYPQSVAAIAFQPYVKKRFRNHEE